MMAAMREMLVGDGRARRRDPAGGVRLAAAIAEASPADATTDRAGGPLPTGDTAIVFRRAGRAVEAAPGRTVLEAAEDAGVAIPFECRSGICGQCKTPLVSGRVTMDVQDALSAADRARGLILACQARALQPIEVDA